MEIKEAIWMVLTFSVFLLLFTLVVSGLVLIFSSTLKLYGLAGLAFSFIVLMFLFVTAWLLG